MSFFKKLGYWTTHGLKDIGKKKSNYQSPTSDAEQIEYGKAHAGQIAGPMAPYQQSQPVAMPMGSNPFSEAASRAGIRVNNSPYPTKNAPMGQQVAMAEMLRRQQGGV